MRRLAIVAVSLLGAASPAYAQFGSAPYRGLFGGASSSREHTLDITATLFGAYITGVPIDSQDAPAQPAQPTQSSWAQGANAVLNYQRNWRTASLGAYATGGASYVVEYADAGEDPWVDRWQVGVTGNLTRQLSRRATLNTHVVSAYSPYYGFGVGTSNIGQGNGGGVVGNPDQIGQIPGLDYAIATQPSINTLGSAMLRYQLSRKSSFEGHYDLQSVLFFGDESPEGGNQISNRAGARYRYQINRFVSARVGYAYRRASYGTDEQAPVGNHDLDLGVDGGYGREFELARRTTFSFSTSSSVYLYENFEGGDSADASTDSRFFVGGSAALRHRWGRTWQAQLRYDRTASFVAGFEDPFFSNIATATVRGLPSRRIDLSAVAMYNGGVVGFTGPDRSYGSASAVAQIRAAVTRNLATYAQYFYYHYNFEQGANIPSTIAPTYDRHGASFGLTFWLPLL